MYLKSFLKHCDLVFTPTRGLSEYLEAACGVPSHKLEVLPTGLEEASYLRVQERIQRVRSDYQAFDCPLFLSVSRLSPEKNIDFLLESLALVKRRCKKPFKMVFAGDGPERKRYEERCRELGLSETVFFAGRVKNEALAPYYQAADAFLFASKTETQGIVILEAFAGGTPVYALRATGVSDLVTEGVNGRLTEEKLSDYADKVIDFLEGREDVRKLSRNAYETALEYREEAVAICALRHYNRIIAVKEDCKISGIEGQQWRTTSITY